MGKRRYRSIEFKQVDWSMWAERLSEQRVVVAIDVAKEDFVASLLGAEETPLVRFKWVHPDQTRELMEELGQIAEVAQVEAVLEPSGTYGDALRWQLQRLGIPLYRVSPKRVHDAAEVYDGVASLHDPKAAEIIGYLHVHGRTQRWEETEVERRELSAQLTRLRICKQRYQAELNRLEAHLSRHWPESLRLFELGSVSLHKLIATYGCPAQVHAACEKAREQMRHWGRAALSAQRIEQLLSSAAQSVGVPCVEEERKLLQWLAQSLLDTHQQLRQIERLLERRVEDDPTQERMAKVIGKLSSAVLLATQGPPQAYPDASSYCKSLGLNLKEHSSGKHKGQLKITKRGPSVARFYLYYAALRLIGHDPTVQRWFELKTQRPGALKNKTVVELMRKLAKALWHIARGEAFNTAKLFNLSAVEAV